MAFLYPLPHPTIQRPAPNRTLSSARFWPRSNLLLRWQCTVSSSSSHDPAVGSSPLSAPDKPEIELEFVSPKAREDGGYHVDRARVVSGEKLMRNIMADSKIELYAAYGKIMNCGGGGSCGTCIVQILNGKELLNERTNTEQRYLKQKPESWRLACQTIVGNKENSGKVVVQRLPQWKK